MNERKASLYASARALSTEIIRTYNVACSREMENINSLQSYDDFKLYTLYIDAGYFYISES